MSPLMSSPAPAAQSPASVAQTPLPTMCASTTGKPPTCSPGCGAFDAVQQWAGDPAQLAPLRRRGPATHAGRRRARAGVGRQHQLEPGRQAHHSAEPGDHHRAALQRLAQRVQPPALELRSLVPRRGSRGETARPHPGTRTGSRHRPGHHTCGVVRRPDADVGSSPRPGARRQRSAARSRAPASRADSA